MPPALDQGPTASHLHFSRKRRVRQVRRARLRWITLGLTALAVMLAVQVATDGGVSLRGAPAPNQWLDSLAARLGLGIRQVEIMGHSFTSDRAIQDTLDLPNVRSLAGFDRVAARQRIERLPWIETAAVTRVFPDRLNIVVTERKAFARWRRGERMHLIDATGRVLTAIQPHAADHLPLVVGEGAPEAAADLIASLALHPDLLPRIEAAERIEGRRWSLQVAGGLTVLLPSEGEAAALDRLSAAGVMQGLSAMSAAIVDVRRPDRMIVRRTSPEASSPAASPALPALAREPVRAQRG